MSESWTLDQDQDFWLRRTKVHADNMIVSVYFRLHPVLHPSGETEEKVGTPPRPVKRLPPLGTLLSFPLKDVDPTFDSTGLFQTVLLPTLLFLVLAAEHQVLAFPLRVEYDILLLHARQCQVLPLPLCR